MMETLTTTTVEETTKLNNSCGSGSNIDSSCGINSGDIVSNESCSLKSLNISISTINNGCSTSGINSSSGGNSPKTPSLQNTTIPATTPPTLLNLSDALSPLRELYSCLYVGDIKTLMSNEYLNFEEDEKIRCLGFPEPHLEINEKTQKYFSYQIIDFDSDEDILSIAKQFEQYSQLILGRTSTQPVVIQECCFGLILAAVYFIKYELFSLPQAHDLIQYNDFFGTTNKHSHFEKVDSCTLVNDITTYYYNNMTKRQQFQKPLPTTPTSTKDKENSTSSSTTSSQPSSQSSSTSQSSTPKLKVSGSSLIKKIFKKHSSSNSKDKDKEKEKDGNNVKKEGKKEKEARETKEREAREKELELELKNIPPEDLYKHQMKKIQMIQQQQIMELNGGVAAAPGSTNVNVVTTTTTTTTPGGGVVTTSNNNLGEPGLIAQANLMDPELIENYDDGSDRLKNSKTIISATYNELPDEYKTMVKSWDIKQESIDLHFDIILSLLHFHTKQRFYQSDAALQNYTSRPKYYNIGNVCGSCSPPIVISSSSSSSSSSTPTNSSTVSTSFYKKPFDQICKKPTNEMKKLYTIRERVGKGGFGTVYLARNNADKTKSRIAIKKLPHIRKKERKFNVKEIRVLEFTKHPNIITYYNSHMLNDEVWIAMEFMEGGTLAEASNQYPFQESNIAYVAREVLQGLAYLHGIQLVHRDLKSQNIMMTTSGEIKIIDFGLCANLSKGERIRMCGSPIWMPPEMIQQRQHGYTCDIWSTAICLLELANRNNKLRKNPIKTMFMVGSEGIKEPFEDPNRWSDSFHDLINKCLQIDPHDRPSAQELLKHPFIQLADNKKKMGKILSSIFLKSIIGV